MDRPIGTAISGVTLNGYNDPEMLGTKENLFSLNHHHCEVDGHNSIWTSHILHTCEKPTHHRWSKAERDHSTEWVTADTPAIFQCYTCAVFFCRTHSQNMPPTNRWPSLPLLALSHGASGMPDVVLSIWSYRYSPSHMDTPPQWKFTVPPGWLWQKTIWNLHTHRKCRAERYNRFRMGKREFVKCTLCKNSLSKTGNTWFSVEDSEAMFKWTDQRWTLQQNKRKSKIPNLLWNSLFFPSVYIFPFLCQACEHHGPAPVPKGSWSLYLLGAQRSQKLEMIERSEAFAPDHYPGSEFHSTFIHMLQDNMSTDGIARTRESNYLFVDTVQSLLCATRPLMYS